MTGTVRRCWTVSKREDHFTGCEVTGPKACLRTEPGAKIRGVPKPNGGSSRPSAPRLTSPLGLESPQRLQEPLHRAQTAPITRDTTALRNIENPVQEWSTSQAPREGRRHTTSLRSRHPASENKNQNPELDSICLFPYWLHLSNLCSAGIAGFGPTRVVREVREAHAPQTTVAV
jgi:hypothetical protein